MKSISKLLALVVFISLTSCFKKSQRNYQFMPNMYKSVGYETYQQSDAFEGDMEAQIPADGTIARGHTKFEIANSSEGYELAKGNLKTPLDSTDVDYARGKELYDIYCGICHGTNGKGQGKLVKREKILGVPNYADREITEGSVYHTIYYGKNTMGSYAGQLNEEERWQVTAYVLKLRAALKK